MKTPVSVVWITLLCVWHSQVAAYACLYDIRGSYSQANDARLTLTKSRALGALFYDDGNYATIAAARLDYVEAGTSRYYLAISFDAPYLVESEEEAVNMYKEHSSMIPKGLEATITLSNDETVVLKSWGMWVGRPSDVAHLLGDDLKDTDIDAYMKHSITPPGKRGNRTELFEVSLHFSGGYDVDEQQRQQLLAQPLKNVQITTEKGDIDKTAHPARTETLQDLLECV